MARHNADGSFAEQKVTEYLAAQGFEVVETNWKTKFCEIDIVAQKDGRMYFVEVKYRQSADQGGGFDYITSQKLHQMRRAANAWVEYNDWTGPYQLSAAEVLGDSFEITFLERAD